MAIEIKNNLDNTLLNANYFAEVPNEQGLELKLKADKISNLAADIRSKFQNAKTARTTVERVWLQAYRNYRGVYGKNVRFSEHEKSRVFVKITKTKVIAAYGMLIDVIFGTTKFPIGIQETEVPEGAAERAHLNTGVPSIEMPSKQGTEEETEENPFDPGYEGDGRVLAPGATFRSPTKFLQDSTENFKNPQGEVVLKEGPAPSPEIPEIWHAKESAKRMQKLIHDQIEESNGPTELRNALFECALLGTGVIKGPYNYNKTLHQWTEEEEEGVDGRKVGKRTYTPIEVRVPRIEFVSIWDVYPDAHATSIGDSEHIIQRRKFNRSQLRDLIRRPHFNAEAIRKCLKAGPNYIVEDFEKQVRENASSSTGNLFSNRFEILEYWGIMDAKSLREINVDVPDSIDDLDEVQINAWVCGDEVLRAVINPFRPHRLPYLAFPYESNPYSFWGVGVAENMDDSQMVMNGHARMAIDNLALSGSVIFDIDETALVSGQSMSIYPGKIFRRQAGAPGQAIFPIKIPNTSTENLLMFDKFRQLADESTGIPSFSHGQTGVQSMTRTASGMSMLLGAASLNIKTVVKNIDDFLLKPLGDGYFQWNNQFFDGVLGIKGDLEVRALGTSSLMQKEVRSQRITTFLQISANPAIAPYIKIPKLIEIFAESMDEDPREILNSPEEAAIAAALIGAQNIGQTNGAQASSGGPESATLGASQAIPSGTTDAGTTGNGNGTIGTGNVPLPSDPSFSG